MEIGEQIYSDGILCKVTGLFTEIPKEYRDGLPHGFLASKAILINKAMPLGKEVRVVFKNIVTKGYVTTQIDNSPLLILSSKSESTIDRAYFRLPLHLNVHIAKSVVASSNIGGGGLAFIIDSNLLSFPIGEFVEVSFELPNGYLFLGTGRILRENALEFINLAEKERGILLNHLYTLQKKIIKGGNV